MKKLVDERINRVTNALAAQAFWQVLALQAVVLAVKAAMGAGIGVCILDIAVLAVGLIGMVLLRSMKSLWGAKDDALREIDQACLAKVFMVMFWLLIVGELVLVLADEQNIRWYAPYPLVWFVPAMIIMVRGIRSGCFVWGGRKAEESGKQRLLKGTIVGAAFFGIIMGGPACFKDGAFQIAGLWQVLAMGALWGVMYYWLFRLLMLRGEKAADKAVAAAEGEGADEE